MSVWNVHVPTVSIIIIIKQQGLHIDIETQNLITVSLQTLKHRPCQAFYFNSGMPVMGW
jgi:hypothetical protein